MGWPTSTISTAGCSSFGLSLSLLLRSNGNGQRASGKVKKEKFAGAVLVFAVLSAAPRQAPPARDYFVFVASESVDRIALLRFGPGGITIERERYVGLVPTELAGPHGLAVSPDKKHYYVSTAHGM